MELTTLERAVQDAAAGLGVIIALVGLGSFLWRKGLSRLPFSLYGELSPVVLFIVSYLLTESYGLRWMWLALVGLIVLSINFAVRSERTPGDYIILVMWYSMSAAWANFEFTSLVITSLEGAILAGLRSHGAPLH